MCTLILGIDVAGPGTVIAGGNRDEDPGRPSDPPGLLVPRPRVVGGRDRRAGGTWLAVRESRALVAMLNRRERGAPPADRRSRGLLALETAAVDGPGTDGDGAALARAAAAHALAALEAAPYAAFSMVFATPGACWMLAHEPGERPRLATIGAGWHVLTHAELDDPSEPRAARLKRELADLGPASLVEAARTVAERLREHGAGRDAVCIHDGPMVTVSSSRVWLEPGGARYLHREGRPCEGEAVDVTPLLAAGAPTA
jgi:hypothetical protein